MSQTSLGVALIGAGWAGEMHARAYERVYGVDLCRHTVCALEDSLPEFARRHGFLHATKDYQEVLANPAIQVVDIVTPPVIHKEMIIAALRAGKHVVCEKPLVGYFGEPEDEGRIGDVSREKMLRKIRADIEEIEAVLQESGRMFFYAENWLYAPAFREACKVILKKGTTVLHMQAMAAHKGSHASYVANWSKAGGGTSTRNMIHPVSAALYLKRKELVARGAEYALKSVYCDCARVTAGVEKGHIAAAPVDVEDFSHMVLTFSDGTKATVTSTDLCLGGLKNVMEIYGSDATFRCNFNPNNLLEAYISDNKGLEDELLMEKGDVNLGYQFPLILDEVMRGYYAEIQDFMECIRDGREPEGSFELAKEAMEVLSLGYLSAELGRRIDL